MKPIQLLTELEYQSRYDGKSFPEYAKFRKKYTDKTANGLTKCVIDFLRLTGNQAERINTTGRMLDQRKVATNCLGQKQQVGSVTWIKGSGQRGSADVSATINGRSVKIEVKIGRDRQSEYQKAYQKQIEGAGGQYWLVRSFDQFIELYESLLSQEKNRQNEHAI